jgi:hypothetical protein
MKTFRRFYTLAVWGLILCISLIVFGSFGAVVSASTGDPAFPIAATSGFGLGLGLMFMGTIDMFDSRTMLQALEQMLLPRQFITKTFFKIENNFTTENVDVDIEKGKRKMAPFVSPLLPGKLVEHTGFVTRSFKPPYLKPKMKTTAVDILKRDAGNTIYQGNMTPAARAQQQLGKDLLRLTQDITRREEWMAAQALMTGKVTCVGEGMNVEVDFLMSAGHKITLTSTALWTDPLATPVTNIRTWKNLLAKDSGLVGDIMILGEDVIGPFLVNAEVQKLLDKTKISLGVIDPKDLDDGVTYYGRVEGVDIYTYNEWYVDDADGTSKPMIPADKIMMGSTRARCERMHGAVQDLEVTAAVPYFPKSWIEKDPSAQMLLVQSAPLMVPIQIDAFMYATVK